MIVYFLLQRRTTATVRSRARTSRTSLHTASQISRAATAVVSGSSLTAGPLSLRFMAKDDKLFLPAAKTLFEYVYYCEGDIRKVNKCLIVYCIYDFCSLFACDFVFTVDYDISPWESHIAA